MNDAKPTLRDIAQLASNKHGGVRGRALDRVAKKRGLTLSYTTVDRILAGNYTSTPSRKTLDALAELAAVDKEKVYEAAGLPVPLGPLAEQLPPDADLLTGSQRDAVIAVVRQFAAVNRALFERDEVMGNAEHPAPNTELDEKRVERVKQDMLASPEVKRAARRTRRKTSDEAHSDPRPGNADSLHEEPDSTLEGESGNQSGESA